MRKRNAVLIAIAVIALPSFAYLLARDRPVDRRKIDPGDPVQAARGRVVYERHCAACHGANLEGQPDWRRRRADGRLPAPPHDDSGHTWHHPGEVLFGITRNGLVPPYAPAGYPSDMPAFVSLLSDDDIRAVLAFIESRWSPEVVKMRNEMIARQSRSRSTR